MTTVNALKCYVADKVVKKINSELYGFDFKQDKELKQALNYIFQLENDCVTSDMCHFIEDIFYHECIAKDCITTTTFTCSTTVIDITPNLPTFEQCSQITIQEL